MRTLRFIDIMVAAIAAWLVAACTKHPDYFCCTSEESCAELSDRPQITPCTDPAQPYCDDLGEYGPRHACIPDPNACSASADCPVPLVCDVGGTNTCVACTREEAAACTGATPVCGDDHACRGCASHAECAGSDVCLPDGSCADPVQVAYVKPLTLGGTDNPSCTFAMPCTKVTSALQTGRPYVKIAGTNDEGNTISIDNRNVTLLADGDAKLVRTSIGVHLEVKGTSQAEIYDLEISGGLGAQGIGLSMPAGNTAKLTLQRVKILNNTGGGILATGGTLTVSQSTLSDNTGGGIAANGGSLTVSQSTISGNTGGGISISNAQFDITNSNIIKNGGPSSLIGGIDFQQIPTAGTRRLEFNTIANNAGNATINSGINCGTVVTPVTFSNNIIFANIVSGGGKQLGGSVNCLATYSDIGPDTISGIGNINMDPLFVDVLQSNFHLQPTSPAKEAADPAASLAVDIDGDVRPQGAARDIGADEVR